MDANEDNALSLPIICLTTVDGGFFGVGMPPSYPDSMGGNGSFMAVANQEGLNNISSKTQQPKHLLVNAIHEDPHGAVIEILTETGLTKEDLAEGIRSVSMLKIPKHNVAVIKAGYVRGIPRSPEDEITEEE